MSNFVSYKNGNYTCFIDLDNGTKIRKNNLDFFEAESPESIDCKITNSCDRGCVMCHENSVPNGKHADIMNAKFFESMHPYTEIAIGGGNPLEHPDLEEFLYRCKELKLIPSMTVHQYHFLKSLDFFRKLRDNKLIYGIGVSVSHVTDELIEALQEFPTAVVHLIAGCASESIINRLKNHNLQILILGYKYFRRGIDHYDMNSSNIDFLIQYMYDLLPEMIEKEWFNTISFDNLAIEQLNVKRLMSEEEWNEFYMGDDGTMTFYVDLVNEEFGVSSTAEKRFPLMDNIVDMFSIVKEEKKKNDQERA